VTTMHEAETAEADAAGGAASQDGDDTESPLHRDLSSSSDGIQRCSSSGGSGVAGSSLMLMGGGSSSFVRSSHPVWPSVVEVEGGRDSLLAECFRAMQRYQIRSLRLQMRLENLTRCTQNPSSHAPSAQGSSSHPGSYGELPQQPLAASLDTKLEKLSSAAAATGRSSPLGRGRTSSIDGKTERPGSGQLRGLSATPSGGGGEERELELHKTVLELTAELDAQKHKVFETSAQLRSLRVANRTMARQNEPLVSRLLQTFNSAAPPASHTLSPEDWQAMKSLLQNMRNSQEDESETLSGEEAVDEGDWRPYVTQAHPGTNTSQPSSPMAQARGL